MRNKVVVVGSINVDLTIRTKRLPQSGETVLGGIFSKGDGGKGSNQAIAALRAGAEVSFIARVGSDADGRESVNHLIAEGINTRHIVHDNDAPTGRAFILVDEHGENSIVVASGANARLTPQDVDHAQAEILASSVLLVQLESPLETIRHAIHLAAENKTLVIVNPAPAQRLETSWLHEVDVMTPNRIEAEMLTDVKITDDASLAVIARRMFDWGVRIVVITLGKRGVFLATKERMQLIPAYAVNAVDSTGAGDVFSGSLAAFLAEGMPIEKAVRLANAAASQSVTRAGAQTAAPFRAEMEKFMARHTSSELKRREDKFTFNPSQLP